MQASTAAHLELALSDCQKARSSADEVWERALPACLNLEQSPQQVRTCVSRCSEGAEGSHACLYAHLDLELSYCQISKVLC